MLLELMGTTAFKVASTAVFGSVYASTYVKRSSANDHEKIVKIADQAGLKSKDEKIRIFRRSRGDNYQEYVYKMPLGLSFKQFKEKEHLFIDGLNNKSETRIRFQDFKGINWKSKPLKQIQDIFNRRVKIDKKLELEYDGMLVFRVYEKGLDKMYPYSDDMDQGKWRLPIGYTYKDIMVHDFEKRPHLIAAGTTGFGKSEFVKMAISLLIKQNEENVNLHLIDLKGGSELRIFKQLKQTKNFARTVSEAKDVLQNVQNQLERKSDWLFDKGYKDVKSAGDHKRQFVVIDEAATLDQESRDIVTDIARRGRAAGFRLIYATQYPTNETLPSQVRANIGARVCFRLETNAQSRAVLDEGGAEELPEIEGRAIFRRVSNHEVQTPHMFEKQMREIIKPFIQERGEQNVAKENRKDGTNIVKFEEI